MLSPGDFRLCLGGRLCTLEMRSGLANSLSGGFSTSSPSPLLLTFFSSATSTSSLPSAQWLREGGEVRTGPSDPEKICNSENAKIEATPIF